MARSAPAAMRRPSYLTETRLRRRSPKVVGATALRAAIEQPEQLEPWSQMSGGELSAARAWLSWKSPSCESPRAPADRLLHFRKSRLVNMLRSFSLQAVTDSARTLRLSREPVYVFMR
jgi:hypothetical protein